MVLASSADITNDREDMMADRSVTHSRKDRDGDITALCNPSAAWSLRLKQGAINDIESGEHTYYVLVGGRRADIYVVKGVGGKHLRTSPDTTSRNNLEDLPDC